MESFFATIKRELDLKKLPTREGRMQAIFEFIEVFYNRKRAHSSLKYKSPKEYENTLEPKKVTIKKKHAFRNKRPCSWILVRRAPKGLPASLDEGHGELTDPSAGKKLKQDQGLEPGWR